MGAAIKKLLKVKMIFKYRKSLTGLTFVFFLFGMMMMKMMMKS